LGALGGDEVETLLATSSTTTTGRTRIRPSSPLGNRLTRGPTYARNGQAISLDVLPGEVRAMMVQGSRARPGLFVMGSQSPQSALRSLTR
jgi:hypothetical protein